MSHRDSLQLVTLNDLNHLQSQGQSNSTNEQQQFQNSQEMVIESSSSEFMEVQEDDRLSPTLGSPNTPLSSSNLVTTLELHPNVILGMPEDEVSSGGGDGERPFLCAICQASYKTKTHLRRHMYIHMSSRPFPCPECGKGFNRKEHLNKHLEAVHSGNKHHCPYCDKQISRMDHLRRHIKNMHTNLETLEPADKGTVLKVQVRGRKHKAQLSFLTPKFPPGTIGQTIITPIPLAATSSGGEKLSVTPKIKDEPEEQGSSSASPNEDTSTTSMTIIPSNILPGQGIATLAVQSTLNQKVLVHQRLPTGSSVNLTTVTNGLAGLADLSVSLGAQVPLPNLSNSCNRGEEERMEGKEDKDVVVKVYDCNDCSSTFSSERDLAVHMRTHKPQPFRCPECGKAYTRREKLTEHIRCVHQGQKFSCEFCGKELSRKDHVLRHIRSVHPEVYAASFAEIDDSQITLDEHGRLVSVNPSLSTTSNLGRKKQRASASFSLPSLGDVGVLLRSVCHVCLKVFGTAYHLTRHIESCHNGDVRPFSCSACNKMFKRKDHLTKHIKSHCPTLKQEQNAQSRSSQNQHEQQPREGSEAQSLTKSKSSDHSTPKSESVISERGQQQSQEAPSEVDHDGDLGMLSEGSGSSSDCHHAILQNLQVEMSVGSQDDESVSTNSNNAISSSILSSDDVRNNDAVGGVLIGGTGIIKHSNNTDSTATEFSLAVIDSFMQGGVNVVVVDEEISNFLQQTSSAHLTTTFPCAQCQREFSQRDQLIAHALQEHANEAMLHGHHHQHISDISFPDF